MGAKRPNGFVELYVQMWSNIQIKDFTCSDLKMSSLGVENTGTFIQLYSVRKSKREIILELI